MSFNQFTESAILCPNCGAQNGSSATVCRNCGAALTAQPQYQQPQQPQYPQYQDQYQQPQYPQYQDQYQQPQYDQYQQPQQPQYDQYQQPQYPQYDQYQPQYDLAADVAQNKVKAVLAYFGILVLVPILGAKDSAFARFHANQGLTLWLISIVLSIFANIPVIGIVAGICGLVTFVLSIMGIVNACKGEMKELPITGNIKVLK